jgi:hypothetical protein
MTKKSMRKGRSRRPAGRNPVIAVRVSEPMYKQIKEAAKQSRQTMSEQMAALLRSAFEWQVAFSEAKELKAEFSRLMQGDLKGAMRRAGWVPLHGSPYWLPPGSVPTSGFIKAEVAELERRITALKTVQSEGEAG